MAVKKSAERTPMNPQPKPASVHLSDYLDPNAVVLGLPGKTKRAVLEALAEPLLHDCKRDVAQSAIQALLDREKLGSTATGEGVAIPHSKVPDFPGIRVAFGRHDKGIKFDAPDEKPVQLFFLILAPNDAPAVHLKLLAKIARLAHDAETRSTLLQTSSLRDVADFFAERDAELEP